MLFSASIWLWSIQIKVLSDIVCIGIVYALKKKKALCMHIVDNSLPMAVKLMEVNELIHKDSMLL